MKILYGVVGEGMGHAMRSRVVLDHLAARGHDLHVVVSGRAHDYLSKRTAERLQVSRIWGYSAVYEENEMALRSTLLQNLRGAWHGLPHNVRTYFELVDKFAPDAVVSDFETWSYLFGKNWRLPVISLDNIQMLDRCEHAPEISDGYENDFRLARAFIKPKLSGAYHYLITTFFYPAVRKRKTTLHPSVLRPEILALGPQPAGGEHLLVYQTSTSNTALPEVLARCGLECRIYGLRRDLKSEVVEGNLRYRPFSETQFIEDLRTARGVIANGGFTLLSEAVYLHRPVLSVPVSGQFEQVLNSRYLEREGYGLHAERITDSRLGEFLERIPDFDRKLTEYRQDGNRTILEHLDRLLSESSDKTPVELETAPEED